MIFKNAIANYHDTEGGVVSLLNGVPPLPGAHGTRDLYRLYAHQPSIIPLLKKRGYQTELYTTADLTFLRHGDYLKSLGFSVVVGRDDTPSFSSAPRFSFNAPADEVLYQKLLTVIHEHRRTSTNPLFLTGITLSSHLPWISPNGGAHTEASVWGYVDTQIANFVDSLKKENFFAHGILLIIGDHRKMTPVTTKELDHFGPTAPQRIAFAAIGKGIPANSENDQLIQQSDVLRYLSRILDPSSVVTQDAIVPDRFSRPWLRDGELIARFKLFQGTGKPSETFSGWLAGSRVIWDPPIPPRAHRIEEKLLSQRLALDAQPAKLNPLPPARPCLRMVSPIGDVSSKGNFSVYRLETTAIEQIDPNLTTRLPQELPKIDFFNVLQTSLAPRPHNFGLLFVRRLEITDEGWYFFRIESDDGACLLIDTKQVINANYPHSFGHHEGGIYLDRGNHALELRYFQQEGRAAVRLLWSTPTDRTWSIIGQ
jgi:hypothetical protein